MRTGCATLSSATPTTSGRKRAINSVLVAERWCLREVVARRPRMADGTDTECAWINRLGEGDESCSTSKDLASHGGPESCVCVREDVGEALTGVRAGMAIEPRNQSVRGADVVPCGGRQHRWSRWMIASGRRTLRGRRTSACTSVSKRENREIPRLPVTVDDAPSWMVRGVADRPVAGREGKAKATSPR
jgi:hypothetical protein